MTGVTDNEAPEKERHRECALEGRCSPVILLIMGERVDKGLEDDDAAKPAVDQVVSIKRNAQEGNERVVSSSEKEKRNLLEASHGVKSATRTELDDVIHDIGVDVDIPC